MWENYEYNYSVNICRNSRSIYLSKGNKEHNIVQKTKTLRSQQTIMLSPLPSKPPSFFTHISEIHYLFGTRIKIGLHKENRHHKPLPGELKTRISSENAHLSVKVWWDWQSYQCLFELNIYSIWDKHLFLFELNIYSCVS